MHEFSLDGMLLSHDFRRSIYDNCVGNGLIDNYYQTLKEEFGLKNSKMAINILNKQARIRQCNKYWELDYYLDQKVKDMTKTYYCKDKFCLNCKKWRQAQRMKKFLPVLQQYDDDLYFVTFTIPNCDGLQVKETIKKIFSGHKRLVDYLLGLRKTKLFDRKMFNFIGGLRVLEISINRTSRHKYHVHLHCAYILKDFKMSTPKYQNSYSIDNSGKRDYIRKFSLEEITLQKLWFIFYNNISLKKCPTIHSYKALNSVTNREKLFDNNGYSVTIDKFKPGQYQEMFKYMIKDHATYVDENGDLRKDVLFYD
ncbi:protein rep, partial [Clostridium intestinale]